MRPIIQRFAIYLAAAGILIWLLGGARLGFYVVAEKVVSVEPVTAIENTEWQDKFLPGIEFLAGGLIFGGSCISALPSKCDT